jgi:hypothetical protein
MEKQKLSPIYRWAMMQMILCAIGGLSFLIGVACSSVSGAESPSPKPPEKKVKTIYPDKTKFDFEGAQIEGEIRNPGEFYFQHKPQEKFDSLIKRRKNFHREMLRDVVFSK